MANDKQKLFRQKITEAVAEFGSFPQIASKGEVAKSTWHDVVNGKSLPNLEPTWRNMLAVLRTLPAERFHDVDWDMLYRGACREAGKEIPDDKPQPVHTAPTSGEAPSRLHLERGLASVHVFALPRYHGWRSSTGTWRRATAAPCSSSERAASERVSSSPNWPGIWGTTRPARSSSYRAPGSRPTPT